MVPTKFETFIRHPTTQIKLEDGPISLEFKEAQTRDNRFAVDRYIIISLRLNEIIK